jgi:hypothetical protein
LNLVELDAPDVWRVVAVWPRNELLGPTLADGDRWPTSAPATAGVETASRALVNSDDQRTRIIRPE